MVAIRGRTFKKPWQRSCLSSKLKSSSAPIGREDSWCFHAVGSSNAPLLGSTAAEGLPRIGRTSIATHWRSCGLPQSALCSENFVIPPDVFGQTLRVGVGVEVVAGIVNCDDPIIARVRGIKAYRVDAGVPADDRPILGCKEKNSRSRRRIVVCVDARNHESWRGARQSCDIEDRPGRCPTPAQEVDRRWDTDDPRIDGHRIRRAGRNIIERCYPGAIVRNPERRAHIDPWGKSGAMHL